jgi:translation initiation factor IF-3
VFRFSSLAGSFERHILLTTHIPSWYYSPAKKPAFKGWICFINKEE